MRPTKLTNKTELVKCRCGVEFLAYTAQLAKGNERYCSSACRTADPQVRGKIKATLEKKGSLEASERIKAKRLRCRRCSELKEKTEFVKDKTRAHGYFPWCKACHALRQKEYSKVVILPAKDGSGNKCLTCFLDLGSNVHSNREYCSSKCKDRARRWKEFGLSPKEFEELTVSGKCPLCRCNVNRWVIDHNHETGETTGPVCQRCNQYLLAGSKHSLDIAQNLVDYLTNPPVRRLFGQRRYVGPQSTSQIHRMWLWTGKDNEADNATLD